MHLLTCCFFILFSVSHKEKKKNDKEKKSVEMSQNAQFRAIQPSQSILSYVEENVILYDLIYVISYVLFIFTHDLGGNIHFTAAAGASALD